jgi:hypothetical protein
LLLIITEYQGGRENYAITTGNLHQAKMLQIKIEI